MDDHTDRDRHEEPLFLDEPADMPPYRTAASASIDHLFGDEETPRPPAPRKSPTLTLLLLFLLAALLGFASVRVWML